jgi:hypothetical protein
MAMGEEGEGGREQNEHDGIGVSADVGQTSPSRPSISVPGGLPKTQKALTPGEGR